MAASAFPVALDSIPKWETIPFNTDAGCATRSS